MHPAEQARAMRDLHAGSVPGQGAVGPGTVQEEVALDAIDRARADALAELGETPRSRRRAMVKRLRRDGLTPEEIGRW